MIKPGLSVILLAPTDTAHIQKTIRHLRSQTRAAHIELLIVTPHLAELQAEAETWREFHSVRLVSVQALTSPGHGRLCGYHASSAPIIAFAEDHAFPSSNWAQVLLDAHRAPYAAVGVEMQNANPSPVSRADMFMNFGPWAAPARRGVYPMLPGHNTSYKRETLRHYGAELLAMLNSEAVLHQDLTRRGEQLFLESRAHVAHVNISLWSSFWRHKLHGGRIFAGLRGKTNHWSLFKRVLYGLASPLVPFVRFARLLPDLRRAGVLAGLELKMLAALTVGLMVHATGEMLGYWFGPGDAIKSYAHLELYRESQIRPGERELAFE